MNAARSKIALACIILAASVGGIAAEPAEGLLQKHLEALGGEKAVLAVASVTSNSEIEMLSIGATGTMVSHHAMPCLFRSDISLGFFTVKQGYDGERIWRIDQNGMLIYVQDPESIEDQFTTCLIDSYHYLFAGETFRATAAGIDTIDGTRCDVVELFPDDGTPCRLYLDAETHLLKRLSMETRSGPIHETYDDYRRVKGVMFPFRTRMNQVSLDQTIEVRITSLAVNEPVDPILFFPPPETVSDYRFTMGTAAEMIPFTSHERHIYLPVRIVGFDEELMFMLDSGASMTVIDSALAVRMELPLGERLVGAGAGGMADFYMTRIPGFSIEGVSFAEQTVIAYPISDIIRRFADIEIGGILGYDFLSRFVTRIDFERNLISLFEPDSFVSDDTALDAPLIHNVFSLACTLDGRYGGTFLIDTGASSSIVLKRFADEHGLAGERRNTEISIIGAGGEGIAHLAAFESFTIGGFTIEDPVFALSASDRGIGAYTGIDGIIGNDILNRFTVTLDYRNQKIYLAANSLFAKPFTKDRSGIMLERDKGGGIRIYAVVPGSPAGEAGLAEGDVILSIDGRDVSDFENLEEARELLRGPEETVRTVDIDRSGRRMSFSVKLRAYV